MKRRDFIRNASSLLLIPAYVRAESLMRIWVPSNTNTLTITGLDLGDWITVFDKDGELIEKGKIIKTSLKGETVIWKGEPIPVTGVIS